MWFILKLRTHTAVRDETIRAGNVAIENSGARVGPGCVGSKAILCMSCIPESTRI